MCPPQPTGIDLVGSAVTAPAARTCHCPRRACRPRASTSCTSSRPGSFPSSSTSHIAKVIQPTLPLRSPRTALQALWRSRTSRRCDTRAPRRACAPPVLDQSTTMMPADNMKGTTRPTGRRECAAHLHVPLYVDFRGPRRRRQCCPQWQRDRGKVLGVHIVHPCAEHHRAYGRGEFRSQ